MKAEVKTYKKYYSIAFGAGIVGALVMSLIVALARGLQLTQLDIEMMLGTMITGNATTEARIIGIIWHSLNGGIFALIYAAAFKSFGFANISLGLRYGVVHWIAASVLMGLIPALHPSIPDVIQAPGFFAGNGGLIDFVALFALHLVFGGIIGYACGKAVESSRYLTSEFAQRSDSMRDQPAGVTPHQRPT